MGEFAATIARRIRREGPISVAAFMAIALHDPQHGYYATRDPFGQAGDFTTSPEISQIFGEMIGLWGAALWQEMGRPPRVVVAELGPGRGTLMADFLRAAATVPGFRQAIALYLVEASPVLREAQQQRLGDAAPRFAAPRFADSTNDLPDAPLLLVANEFLDALPVRQLIRGASGWAERVVALDAADRLVFADSPETPALSLLVPVGLRGSPAGTTVEICPAAAALAATIGEHLKRRPGAALFIDYGYSPSAPGPTLTAIRRHEAADVLADPGCADLSAHVDFATFAAAAQAAGAETFGPVPQGRFLVALGAETRLAALLGGATPAQRVMLDSGLRRLIDPAQMGTLFKALALTSPGLPEPPGFAAA